MFVKANTAQDHFARAVSRSGGKSLNGIKPYLSKNTTIKIQSRTDILLGKVLM
jgi:hypothetical protein